MLNSSLVLVNQPGHVFETTDFGQRWTAGNAEEGLSVENDGLRVKQALVEFSFILPPLSKNDPGCYSIFTLAKSEADSSGVFLRVNYEPSKGLIHCGMNAGTQNRDLHWVSLGPAPVEEYTGRVLRAFILIAPTGLYPSIEDMDSDPLELFGELRLPWSAEGDRPYSVVSGMPPWGAHPTGDWWITSGCKIEVDQGIESFPPGFGLSDVRIHLADPSGDDFHMLPYSGGLDHLVADSEDLSEWDLETEEEPLSELLKGFADEIGGLASEVIDWTGRALDLADETDKLAIRLLEEEEEDYGDVYDYDD